VHARNTPHQSFENFLDVWLQSLHFAGLEDFNELGNEHDFFGGVGKRPVLEQSIEQEEG